MINKEELEQYVKDLDYIFTPENIELPDFENINWIYLKEPSIRCQYPKLHKYLIDLYPEIDSWMEKVWLFKNHLFWPPKCPTCGKSVSFNNIIEGYHKVCYNINCSMNNPNLEKSDKIFTPQELRNIDGNKKSPKYISNHFPQFFEFINNLNLITLTGQWNEKRYLYENEMKEPERCHWCGKYTNFNGSYKGYDNYCSSSCKNHFKKPQFLIENEKNPNLYKILSPQEVSQLRGFWISFNYLNINFPKFCKLINDLYPYEISWDAKLYLYKENLKEPPICKREGCPNYSSFKNIGDGFNEYCCEECHRKRKNRKQPSDKIFTREEIKEILSRHEHDSIKRNVIEWFYPKFLEYLNNMYPTIDKWMEKIYLYCNNLDKPKVCQYCGAPVEFRNVYKGYDDHCEMVCVVKDPAAKEKVLNTLWEKNNDSNILKFLGNDTYLCKCLNPECNECKEKQFEISRPLYNYRKNHCQTICPIINPIKKFSGTSQLEQNYQKFLEEQGYNIIKNDRNVLKRLELDIYLPDYNLGIEINGQYWHSLQEKNEVEHLNKWMLCNQNGISLITLWEDWDFDLGCQFIIDTIKGNDLSKYKEIWFPDIPQNSWPLDLGLPINIPNIKIQKHLCNHGGFECSDCGLVIF